MNGLQSIISLQRRILRKSMSLSRDGRGASAIEFALTFPIMIVLLAGTVDLGQALLVSRKMNQITATLGDMVSQKQSWKQNDVKAIIAGSTTIIEPFDNDGLKIKLAIIDIDENLQAKVTWGQGYNTTAPAVGSPSPVELPARIVVSGKQLIAVEATYELTTPFSKLIAAATGGTSYNFDRSFITRPRIQESVQLRN